MHVVIPVLWTVVATLVAGAAQRQDDPVILEAHWEAAQPLVPPKNVYLQLHASGQVGLADDTTRQVTSSYLKRRTRLSADEIESLDRLLNEPGVRELRSWYEGSDGFVDYRVSLTVTISRGDRDQVIVIVSPTSKSLRSGEDFPDHLRRLLERLESLVDGNPFKSRR